jgi:hypothetical protein
MNWTPTGTSQPALDVQLAVALPMPDPHMFPSVVMQMSDPVRVPRREAGAISAWYDGTAFSTMPTAK